MALNFPNNPTPGQVYTAENTTWVWNGTQWAMQLVNTSIISSDTPPPVPVSGQLWYKTSAAVGLYFWFVDADSAQWIDVDNGSSMTPTEADARYLKLTGGDLTGTLGFYRPTDNEQRAIYFKDANGSARWSLLHAGTPNGSFSINRADTAGVFQSAPLTFLADGTVTLTDKLLVSPAGPTTWPSITLRRAANTVGSYLGFQDASGLFRWQIGHAAAADGELTFSRSNAAGAFQSLPLILTSAGDIALTGIVNTYANPANNYVSHRYVKPTAAGFTLVEFCDANGLRRWSLTHGPNADSYFSIERYNSAGVYQNAALSVANDGMLTLNTATISTTGLVKSAGTCSRAGSAGALGVTYHNFNWTGSALQGWVDNTNLGTISFTSDYRVKKDVEPLPSQWETVKNLRPISYTQAEYQPPEATPQADEDGNPVPLFQADDEVRWGFIAHELQDTLTPSAATGTKDAQNLIQSPNPWTLLAALTSALQEAMVKIEDATARIEQLEAQVA